MIISDRHKALLIRSRTPQRIKAMVPHAKEVTVRGRQMLALPHRVDEVRALTNMGIKAPSPILHHYDWSRSAVIANPFEAQLATAAFLTLNRRAYVLNGLGSGKTLAALWAYDYLRSQGLAEKLLVVSPLSTLELTWGDALFEHFPHLDFMVLHASRERRRKMLAQEADIYITNHDGVKILQEQLKGRTDITHVVVDELAQCARNARTGRWKALNTVINKGAAPKACWGLTATPVPNCPSDAWAQCRLITPESVPRYFTRFKQQVLRQVSQFSWVPRKNAMDIVQEAMQPAIRFSREECVDLPPTTFTDRVVPLTPEQNKAYKAMETTLRAQVENGEVTAVNEAVKAMKLVQIACGILYDRGNTEDKTLVIPCKPRVDETQDLIGASLGKAIVFAPFVGVVEGLADILRDAGHRVGVIHGGVKKSDRDDVFHGFQNGSSVDVIVAQPAAMSHGLTLTAASTIIWYAPPNSADIYEQANGRITRPGQKHNTLIVNIHGTAVERRMYARLKNKQKIQNVLLDRVVDSRGA